MAVTSFGGLARFGSTGTNGDLAAAVLEGALGLAILRGLDNLNLPSDLRNGGKLVDVALHRAFYSIKDVIIYLSRRMCTGLNQSGGFELVAIQRC